MQGLAKELDMKLEKLRRVKERQESGGGKETTQNDENDVVVLTRTDRSGNFVPLNAPRSKKEGKGKRRKRHKMVTLLFSFLKRRDYIHFPQMKGLYSLYSLLLYSQIKNIAIAYRT